jgi:GDPmannose 4,6-dehydratase
MHMMLQWMKADDYVVGTGESNSVADFVELARQELDIPNSWMGTHLQIDQRFVRTQEIYDMRADNSKMVNVFKWAPQIKLKDLVKLMVDAELQKVRIERKEVNS